jgi:hypothetical protein
VAANGSALPFDGNGELRGTLKRRPEDITAAVDVLRRCWLDEVIGRRSTAAGARSRFAYEWLPIDELGEQPALEMLQPVGLRLAQAGHKLFTFLFHGGDDDLRRVGDSLSEALRREPQTVTVTSDDLFVPWGMLYLPPDPEVPLHGSRASWTPAGFLGYQHLVEHSLGYVKGYDPRIGYGLPDRRSGVHLDMRIQKQHDTPAPIDSVREILESRTRAEIRRCKVDVADAFCDPQVKEHILFFGAHGCAQRNDERGTLEARVVLEDDDPICVSDLVYWQSIRKERMPNPLCFMMVCEGGHATPLLHAGLGKALHGLGVGCLVGPHIDIPRMFASHYTCRFFEEFFKPGARVASVARDLAQRYMDVHATPLGLAFTLLRGIDNCLVDVPV